MITTEADAKTKWCPFARVIPGRLVGGLMQAQPQGVPAHNRIQEPNESDATIHAAMNCLASGCMAWRAVPANLVPLYVHAEEIAEWEVLGYKNKGQERTGKFKMELPPLPDKGYCGLAGRP